MNMILWGSWNPLLCPTHPWIWFCGRVGIIELSNWLPAADITLEKKLLFFALAVVARLLQGGGGAWDHIFSTWIHHFRCGVHQKHSFLGVVEQVWGSDALGVMRAKTLWVALVLSSGCATDVALLIWALHLRLHAIVPTCLFNMGMFNNWVEKWKII